MGKIGVYLYTIFSVSDTKCVSRPDGMCRSGKVCVVWRVHHGTFGPKTETKVSTISILGPHLGTNFWNMAKIALGTIRIILIPHSQKSHFGKKKVPKHKFCVKIFWNFKNQLTSKGLCVLLDLWWAHVRLGTQDGLVHIVLDLTWAWWHRIFADPIWYSKSTHRLTQYFGTILVIRMPLLIMFGPMMVRFVKLILWSCQMSYHLGSKHN